MPLTFASGQGVPTYKSAAYSNLFITPIVISSITSTVAGQIVVVWTGGLGNNVKYSYALSVSGATATISSSNTTSASGTNTTTLTLSTTASITTTVTITGQVLDGSGSATSGSITTISPFGTVTATAGGTAGVMSITWTGGSGTGVTYTYKVKRAGAVITTGITVSGTAPNITFTFTDTAQYSYIFAVTATAGAATLTSSESVAVTSTNPITLTTVSGASPLIAYSFTSSKYTSLNASSGYYTNLANPGTDSFYVFNSLTSGTTTSTYTFKYLNFSTNAGGGTNYINSTAPKGSIGNNNTAYTNFISSITASTSFTSFTITYWIYITGGANAIWNRFASIGDMHNYQIYDLTGFVENAGNAGSRALTSSTWYFIATTLTGDTLYLWSCAVGNTFPSSSTTVAKGNGISQGVNVNSYFVFGESQWGDGNATFYLADLRIYGSALSRSDLNSMFTSGPITG